MKSICLLLLAVSQLMLSGALPGRFRGEEEEDDDGPGSRTSGYRSLYPSLAKRWSPTETHVGQLLQTLQRMVLEDEIKNRNNRKRVRSLGGVETLEDALEEAFGSHGDVPAKRGKEGEKLVPPVNMGPVGDLSRILLEAVKEIHERQLRDGYIGRANPVRSVG